MVSEKVEEVLFLIQNKTNRSVINNPKLLDSIPGIMSIRQNNIN